MHPANGNHQRSLETGPAESGFNFGLSQLLANMIGAALVTFYFTFLDHPDLDPIVDSTLIVSGVMTAGLIFLGIYFGRRFHLEIDRVGEELRSGRQPEPERLARVQRKVLNAPLIYSMITMFNWGLASLVVSGHRFLSAPAGESVTATLAETSRMFFGVLISGVATASIVLFLTDRFFRRIRPHYFPHGGLVEVPGVFRLTVRNRLLFTFMMVSVAPMLVLGVLFYHHLTTNLNMVPSEGLGHLMFAILFILAVVIILAVVLSGLVAGSIAGPIKEMDEAMARVRTGDLSVSVVVTHNDELGVLADSFNQMTDGLKERDRMRQSLGLAMQVQQNLLPQQNPDIPGLDIAGRSIYCEQTGGDYFDYLAPKPGDHERIGVVVGDVSDHGLPSALLMTTVRGLLRQRTAIPGGLARIITDVNRQLAGDTKESGQFMTMFLCEFDTGGRRIRWVNAGHDPGLIYDPARDLTAELPGRGLALGIFEDVDYQEYEQVIAPGQIILIGTDGIWEARNSDGLMFGKGRLKDIIRAQADRSAQEAIDAVIAELYRFIAPRPIEDDVTLVIVKVLPDITV